MWRPIMHLFGFLSSVLALFFAFSFLLCYKFSLDFPFVTSVLGLDFASLLMSCTFPFLLRNVDGQLEVSHPSEAYRFNQ